jgi:thiosulfate/3-mercaptopyruvate sulfurtransferase
MIFTTANNVKFIFETANRTEDKTRASPILLDMSHPDGFALRGAHWVDFNQIVVSRGDTVGLVAPIEALNQALAHTGVNENRPIFIVDDSQGLSAARLAWTLALCGLEHTHLVDGGRAALLAAGFETHSSPPAAQTTPRLSLLESSPHLCTAEMIIEEMQNNEQPWIVLDTRSEAEYLGTDQRSRHAGHVPGAIHLDWQSCFDPKNPGYLLSDEAILAALAARGITPEANRTLAVYCQSHRRSSLMFFILKHLGFKQVRGYPGAWSDWGNRDDLPIAR